MGGESSEFSEQLTPGSVEGDLLQPSTFLSLLHSRTDSALTVGLSTRELVPVHLASRYSPVNLTHAAGDNHIVAGDVAGETLGDELPLVGSHASASCHYKQGHPTLP
jgi:hypothetical protein